MQFLRATIWHLHEQPRQCGTMDVRPFVSKRLINGCVGASVASISISNEMFHAYENDLGMT